MSMKVEKASIESPRAITSPAGSQKITMFGAKSGFVIPRNKLSGSLVPAFRSGKKQGGSDAANGENTKQVQRKTNWGPDLTQDASVKRGLALAYQTRVDQITKQLKSGMLETGDDQDVSLTAQVLDRDSLDLQDNSEKLKLLELEKRELVGEILKLNPSYKAPPDFKAILKEARIPIPVKEYPGYDFIGLICGPGSDTVKRLEKETGAKVQIYGTKAVTGEKREISSSDVNENHIAYEDLYIHVSADTFEKIDAAVSLIELLVTPVLGNPTAAVSTPPTSVPADSVSVPNQSQASATSYAIPPVVGNQGTVQSPSHSQFQHQPQNWISTTSSPHTSLSSSGFTPLPISAPILSSPTHLSSQPFNPTAMSSRFSAPPTPMAAFVPPRLQQPMQGLQPRYLHLAGPLSHTGPARNPSISGPPQPPLSLPNIPSVFTSSQPAQTGLPSTSRPLMPSLPPVAPRPLQSMPSDWPLASGRSSGWSGGPTASSSNLVQRPPPLFQNQGPHLVPPQTLVAPIAPPTSSTPNMGPPPPFPFQMRGSHASGGSINQPVAAPMSSASSHPKPSHVLTPAPAQIQGSLPAMPVPSAVSSTSVPPVQSVIAVSVSGALPSFTPLRPPSVAAPKPQHPSSGDFTFQPLRAQSPTVTGQPPHLIPQTPSFRPAMPAAGLPVMQPFSRPQASNQISQPQAQVAPIPFPGNPNSISAGPRLPLFPAMPSTPPAPQLGVRNASPALPMPNMASSFPPRPPLQQNYVPSGMQPENAMAPNTFASGKPAHGPAGGGHQVYDPFSPTSAPHVPQQGGDLSKGRKQESDPEYEDLMASVGVR